ncbi:acetylhydrolase [Bradyrhizobium sp. CCGUVB14]|uniref:alpha/beta hydrolase family protein n=1 Tax=Bradyrhizobium sp. CCGUVB14 TaxID=2949628 RepID=UPI0020B2E8D7|nr:acetylhydrolase [Bradyrhizobium sp. CCGUVB14]MCP3446083.1 acetylhydrolase [Bradyrhizobium sp. CCGUVB14]
MKRQFWVIFLACVVATTLPAISADAQVAAAQQEVAAFRTVDFDWVDTSRGRKVPARLYWPAAASSGRVPLIVFSHGMGGTRNGYTYLARQWATHGIASLHVQHTGSDSGIWFGNPFGVVDRLQAAAQDDEAAARAGDLRFALDQILSTASSPYAGFIDPHRIVAAGHSYGANTTLLMVGARVVRNGRWVAFRDSRYRAAIVISAPAFYGEKDLAGVLANVSVPTLHVTSTEDDIRIPGFYSPASDRLAIFNAVPNSRKLLAVFQGGSHSMFTDRPLVGGVTLNPMVKEATADLTLAFLDYAFGGQVNGLSQWSATWRNLLAQLPAPMAVAASPAQRLLQPAAAGIPTATVSEASGAGRIAPNEAPDPAAARCSPRPMGFFRGSSAWAGDNCTDQNGTLSHGPS